MRMLKIAITTLALGVAAPAVASEPMRFEYEGETYSYTVSNDGDARIIAGKALSSGQSFRLKVRNGRVTGMSRGVPVAFRLSDVRPVVKSQPVSQQVSMR